MHLAGRTARCGADGLALTLVTHQQAPRVAAFGERLGVGFELLEGSGR